MSNRLFALLLFTATAHAEPRLFEAVEPHMGTLFKIQLYANRPEDARVAFSLAFARIAQLDHTLSDYDPGSELNRVCRTAVRKPVHISDELYTVLQASQDLAYRTDGAFDVTIGPLTRLWREARKAGRLPDTEALAEAKTRTGYRKLHLDGVTHQMLLDEREMRLDAGGIAKGYAADQALLLIGMRGIKSALVAASGDLAFSDPPPGQKGWKIGVVTGKTLVLRNGAVSTSGDSEQHMDVGGKRYSHILNPLTGTALTDTVTVTVLAAKGIEADALATALSVMGEKRGLRFLQGRKGVSAIFSH